MALTLTSGLDTADWNTSASAMSLSITPERSKPNKITGNMDIVPLRGRYSILKKNGHARWEVTIS